MLVYHDSAAGSAQSPTGWAYAAVRTAKRLVGVLDTVLVTNRAKEPALVGGPFARVVQLDVLAAASIKPVAQRTLCGLKIFALLHGSTLNAPPGWCRSLRARPPGTQGFVSGLLCVPTSADQIPVALNLSLTLRVVACPLSGSLVDSGWGEAAPTMPAASLAAPAASHKAAVGAVDTSRPKRQRTNRTRPGVYPLRPGTAGITGCCPSRCCCSTSTRQCCGHGS